MMNAARSTAAQVTKPAAQHSHSTELALAKISLPSDDVDAAFAMLGSVVLRGEQVRALFTISDENTALRAECRRQQAELAIRDARNVQLEYEIDMMHRANAAQESELARQREETK